MSGRVLGPIRRAGAGYRVESYGPGVDPDVRDFRTAGEARADLGRRLGARYWRHGAWEVPLDAPPPAAGWRWVFARGYRAGPSRGGPACGAVLWCAAPERAS